MKYSIQHYLVDMTCNGMLSKQINFDHKNVAICSKMQQRCLARKLGVQDRVRDRLKRGVRTFAVSFVLRERESKEMVPRQWTKKSHHRYSTLILLDVFIWRRLKQFKTVKPEDGCYIGQWKALLVKLSIFSIPLPQYIAICGVPLKLECSILLSPR